MKQKLLMLAAVLMSGFASAYAEAIDISSILTKTEGITITADNDATYPWTLDDGWLKSTNKDNNSSGAVTFTITCANYSKVSFDYCLDAYSNDKMIVTAACGNSISENCSYSPAKTGSHIAYFSPGTHTMKVEYKKGTSNYGGVLIKLQNITAQNYTDASVMHTIDNSTPGSLDRELIGVADNLTNVTSLKVTGTMNAADWATIKLLSKLEYIDLSATDLTAIPDQGFYNSATNLKLRGIVWPANLQTIGDEALRNAFLAGVLSFPASLTSIGNSAFYNNDYLTNVTLPAALAEIGTNTFYGCDRLKTVAFTSNPTTIPDYLFNYCTNLTTVSGIDAVETIGVSAFGSCSSLTSVGAVRPITVGSSSFYCCYRLNDIDFSRTTIINNSAFYNCDSLKSVSLPEITTLGGDAFYGCDSIKSVVLGDKITTVKSAAFNDCKALKSVTLGASVHTLEDRAFYTTYSTIEEIYVNAPAPPTANTLTGGNAPFRAFSGTLYVPDYATVEYKIHPYWKAFANYAVNTNALSDVIIAKPLQLSSTMRIPGTPNMRLNQGGSLVVNGSQAQPVADFVSVLRLNTPDYTSSIINNGSNMTSTSSTVQYYLNGSSNSASYWHAICMPYDVNVSEITTDNGAEFVVRYYDGVSRAAGNSGNWQDVDSEATLTAGKGYIFCTSKPCYIVLPATSATRNNIFASNAISTTLDENGSANANDAGWNLVGNPYAAYYDISKMNFTAPITVWNPSSNSYSAYSIADDQLALRPLEAFFVQKPIGSNTIVFNTNGRQTTDVITTPATAKMRGTAERKLIELTLTNGTTSDMTRIVVNADESDDYNMECDAAKMMSYETTAQLYSLHKGVAYAINEGQQQSGTVALGAWMPADGTYTISLKRADTEVELLDNGTVVQMPYTFAATAGNNDGRFAARIKKAPTSINTIDANAQRNGDIYDLQGRKIATPAAHGIYIQNGKKIVK